MQNLNGVAPASTNNLKSLSENLTEEQKEQVRNRLLKQEKDYGGRFLKHIKKGSFEDSNKDKRKYAFFLSVCLSAVVLLVEGYLATTLTSSLAIIVLFVVVMTTIQVLKHINADAFWDDWFLVKKMKGFNTIVGISFFLISAGAGALGVYRYNQNTNGVDPALLEAKALLEEKKAEKIALNDENSKLDKVFVHDGHDKGKKDWNAQSTIKTNKKMISNLTESIAALEAKTVGKTSLTEQHQTNVALNGLLLVGIYLILEVIFQALKRYCSLYDFQVFFAKHGSAYLSWLAKRNKDDEQSIDAFMSQLNTEEKGNFSIPK